MFHILPSCHLKCTSQLGRTWLMPVGSVTIATPRFFFPLPDNHLALVSSNGVARLKVLYEVKMLIFWQHTGKYTTESYEWKKVLLRSGRQAAAPSHGGPRKPDATCDTAGEEGESVYHFEIQLTPLFARKSLAGHQSVAANKERFRIQDLEEHRGCEERKWDDECDIFLLRGPVWLLLLKTVTLVTWILLLLHKRNSWRWEKQINHNFGLNHCNFFVSFSGIKSDHFLDRCGLYQRNI